MAALLQSESPPELVQELNELEKVADDCYRNLQTLRFPKNLAAWATLTRFVQILESTLHQFGTAYTQQFVATIINLGRSGSLLIEWIQKYGSAKLAPKRRFTWNVRLETSSAAAFTTAHNYESFTGCFPAWRRDRAAAEIIAPRAVRFTWAGGSYGRRVRHETDLLEQTHAVSLARDSGRLTLTTSGGDTGEASETLDAAYTSAPLRIGFNASFLLDMLGVVKTGEVEIALKDAESAAEFRPVDQSLYRYRYVAMPMRI